MIMRIFGLLILIIATLIDPQLSLFIIKPEVQLILGTLIVSIILFDDPIGGLLLAIGAIIMYARVYAFKYNISIFDKNSKLFWDNFSS